MVIEKTSNKEQIQNNYFETDLDDIAENKTSGKIIFNLCLYYCLILLKLLNGKNTAVN